MLIKGIDLLIKIKSLINNKSLNKNVCILGWAFKKDTNDTRESAAIYVSDNLIKSNIIS